MKTHNRSALCYFKQVHLVWKWNGKMPLYWGKNPFYNLCTYIQDYKMTFLTLSFLSLPPLFSSLLFT